MYEPVDGLTESTERPSDVGFYGIILDKILDETCEFFYGKLSNLPMASQNVFKLEQGASP